MINPIDAAKGIAAAKAQLEQFASFAHLAGDLTSIDADGDGQSDISQFIALAPTLLKEFAALQACAEYQAMTATIAKAVALVGTDVAAVRAKVAK